MIEQVAIACTGTVSIFLTQSKSEQARKYACLVGIAGQPFWIYATYQAAQWGILALTFLYTLAWSRGIYTHWIVKQ
jgi:hypothetical protein